MARTALARKRPGVRIPSPPPSKAAGQRVAGTSRRRVFAPLIISGPRWGRDSVSASGQLNCAGFAGGSAGGIPAVSPQSDVRRGWTGPVRTTVKVCCLDGRHPAAQAEPRSPSRLIMSAYPPLRSCDPANGQDQRSNARVPGSIRLAAHSTESTAAPDLRRLGLPLHCPTRERGVILDLRGGAALQFDVLDQDVRQITQRGDVLFGPLMWLGVNCAE